MTTNSLEVVAAPVTLWLAPVATAFPPLDAEPGDAWVKVGTSGDLKDGVTVTHTRTVEKWQRPEGPRNGEEELRISLALADLTPEQCASGLADQRALLVRGASPQGPGWVVQFEVPIAVRVGKPEGGLLFQALEAEGAAPVEERFGRLLLGQ